VWVRSILPSPYHISLHTAEFSADTFASLRPTSYCTSYGSVVTVPYLKRLAPGSGHVGFMVDKVALGQVFLQVRQFPRRFSFHQLLDIH
jgi:hypothetical protein